MTAATVLPAAGLSSRAGEVRHTVYGLEVASNVPIPGLKLGSGTRPRDVEVTFGAGPFLYDDYDQRLERVSFVSACEPPRDCPALVVHAPADGRYFRLTYADGVEFVIERGGTRIAVAWPDGLSAHHAALYLLGPVFGFVLRLRGVACLHASAVAVDGRALVLAGPPGAGKSTTAAALTRMGHALVSEDVVALRPRGRALMVDPGYPRVRLWPPSVEALFQSADALPRLTANREKRYLDVDAHGYRFQHAALPLAAIYILGKRQHESAAPSFRAMIARETVLTLTANTTVNYLLDRRMRAAEFRLIDAIVARVPVRLINPPADAARLSELCNAIVDDFHQHACPLAVR